MGGEFLLDRVSGSFSPFVFSDFSEVGELGGLHQNFLKRPLWQQGQDESGPNSPAAPRSVLQREGKPPAGLKELGMAWPLVMGSQKMFSFSYSKCLLDTGKWRFPCRGVGLHGKEVRTPPLLWSPEPCMVTVHSHCFGAERGALL